VGGIGHPGAARAGHPAGGLVALAVANQMNAFIRGVAAPDAAVFAWAPALVLAASVIPARRVLGIQPARLLRVQQQIR